MQTLLPEMLIYVCMYVCIYVCVCVYLFNLFYYLLDER